MRWTTASRLRTVALALACLVGLWLLARGRNSASAPGDQALRGDATRNRTEDWHAPHEVEVVGATDEFPPARTSANHEVPESEQSTDPVVSQDPTAPPDDGRVSPIYTFWDDSGGPPMLDDELTLTLIERADGAAFEPWSESVELGGVRDMQPKYSVALPLPAPGLYRATCRDGRYKPAEVWVSNVDQLLRPRARTDHLVSLVDTCFHLMLRDRDR